MLVSATKFMMIYRNSHGDKYKWPLEARANDNSSQYEHVTSSEKNPEEKGLVGDDPIQHPDS